MDLTRASHKAKTATMVGEVTTDKEEVLVTVATIASRPQGATTGKAETEIQISITAEMAAVAMDKAVTTPAAKTPETPLLSRTQVGWPLECPHSDSLARLAAENPTGLVRWITPPEALAVLGPSAPSNKSTMAKA